MNLTYFVYALSIAKLHPLLSGVALSTFLVLTVSWAARWVVLLRRRRARPLALVLADAIAAGSVHAPDPAPMRGIGGGTASGASSPLAQARPVMTRFAKLDANNWGFSLEEAGYPVATFVYGTEEEARVAHKAMRRVLRNLICALQPAGTGVHVAPEPVRKTEEADFRPERIWAEQPQTVAPGDF